eukprot:gene8029-biopygen1553
MKSCFSYGCTCARSTRVACESRAKRAPNIDMGNCQMPRQDTNLNCDNDSNVSNTAAITALRDYGRDADRERKLPTLSRQPRPISKVHAGPDANSNADNIHMCTTTENTAFHHNRTVAIGELTKKQLPSNHFLQPLVRRHFCAHRDRNRSDGGWSVVP